MDLLNQKTQRIPSNNIYDVFLTIIISIVILLVIYTFVPFSHYNLYIIEPKV
jgi:hypothetical protein